MAVVYSRTGFTPTFGGVLGTDAYYITISGVTTSAGVGAQAQIQYQRQVRPLFDLFSTNTFLALSRPYGTIAIGAFVGKSGSINTLFGGISMLRRHYFIVCQPERLRRSACKYKHSLPWLCRHCCKLSDISQRFSIVG
jgi:hypothetical protein